VMGRRPAVMVMMGLLILVFVIPFTLALGTIVENAPQIKSAGKQIANFQVPAPPEWLEGIPLVGDTANEYWQKAAEADSAEYTKRLSPYITKVAGWLVAQ
ncbi:MAG: AI-2E family transporter YdiK, partial [Gammaproteobacteria bacterium]|nr:AI-2E family transporter YdiK [Gammaproteobacteria bacterium]